MYDRPDLMHHIPASDHPRGDRLPERANRSRRAGGDDFRHLGARCRTQRMKPSRWPMQEIVSQLASAKAGVPSIVFTKNGGQWLEKIADIGSDAVGLDWTTDIGDARRRVGARGAARQFRPRRCLPTRPPSKPKAHPWPPTATAATCVQPGAREFPVHPAGTRRGVGGGGASSVAAVSRRLRTTLTHCLAGVWARQAMSRHPVARQRQQRHARHAAPY